MDQTVTLNQRPPPEPISDSNLSRNVLPAELAFLFLATRPHLDDPMRRALQDIAAQPDFDHAALRDLIGRHRVLHFCAPALHMTGAISPDRDAARLINRRAATSHHSALRLRGALVHVLHLLRGAGIEPILLKGAAVAAAYPTGGARRSYKDLDLLIRETDVATTLEQLGRLGYLVTFPFHPDTDKDLAALCVMSADITLQHPQTGIEIELHWRLDKNERLIGWRYDDLVSNCAALALGPTEVLTLSKPHLFVFLCAHGAKHSWFRLKWLTDISHIVTGLDPSDVDQITQLAALNGLERVIATALALAQKVHQIDLPPDLDRLARAHCDRARLRFCHKSLLQSASRTRIGLHNLDFKLRYFWYLLGLKPGLAYRYGVIRASVLDARDIPVLGLSRSWSWVYALASPVTNVARLVTREIDNRLKR